LNCYSFYKAFIGALDKKKLENNFNEGVQEQLEEFKN
jgi:hypothetical protein